MQITGGTVVVTNGNAHIVGTNVDWEDATAGALFIVKDGAIYYQLAADAEVGPASNQWNVDLSAPYAGTTNAAESYTIHKDFDANGLAIIAVGDTELRTLINRNFAILSAGGISGPSGGGAGEVFFTNLTNGVLTTHTFGPFVTTKLSLSYVPKVIVENISSADAAVKRNLRAMVTGKTFTHITITMVDAPNTANYVLRVEV